MFRNILILVFYSLCGIAQSQDVSYRYTVCPIPKEAGLITNFNVVSDGSVLIPFKGGILSVYDTSWFIAPNKEIYINSFHPKSNDNGLYVVGNTRDSTELYYLKLDEKKKIQRLKIAVFQKGIYNVTSRNNVCFIWGRNWKKSEIGIIGPKGLQWLYRTEKIISQVQINDSNEICFSMDSSIYNLIRKKKILALNEPISGFCYDYKNRLIVSTGKNIAIQRRKELVSVMGNVSGLLDALGDSVFILSNKRKRIYRLFPEGK